MPTWLWRSIVGISGIISLTAILQWGSCRFYVLPQVWPWYIKNIATQNNTKIDTIPIGCNDIDARTIASMMAVLTTLISLSRKAD